MDFVFPKSEREKLQASIYNNTPMTFSVKYSLPILTTLNITQSVAQIIEEYYIPMTFTFSTKTTSLSKYYTSHEHVLHQENEFTIKITSGKERYSRHMNYTYVCMSINPEIIRASRYDWNMTKLVENWNNEDTFQISPSHKIEIINKNELIRIFRIMSSVFTLIQYNMCDLCECSMLVSSCQK